MCLHNLQCFDAVGWAAGRASGLQKTEWWGSGMVICLERGTDLHVAQLMPLPLTVSCFSKIQIGFTFLVLAHLGSPGKRAIKRVCVCVHVPSVLWHCWLGGRKTILPVKIEWRGVVICLEWGADCLHMVKLMPLPLQTPSSLDSFKSRLVLPFWCQLTQVVLGKRLLNLLVVVVLSTVITCWTFDGITWWFDVRHGCQLTFVHILSLCWHNSRCLLCFYFSGTQNFDVIRFATYRTACKLRFVQKRTNCKFC